MQAATAKIWISQMSKDSCSTFAGCSNSDTRKAVRGDSSRPGPTNDVNSCSTLIQQTCRDFPSLRARPVMMCGIHQIHACHTVMTGITLRPFAQGHIGVGLKGCQQDIVRCVIPVVRLNVRWSQLQTKA
jgi:hypothetical protein